MPVDPKTLPQDAETLKKMLVDVTAQLDRTERLLRQLLAAKTGRKSEQLSREQLALFAAELGLNLPEPEVSDDHDEEPPASVAGKGSAQPPHGRKALPRHLKRERLEHDLSETEKHCAHCDQDLRRIGEEVSERYEYIPAQIEGDRGPLLHLRLRVHSENSDEASPADREEHSRSEPAGTGDRSQVRGSSAITQADENVCAAWRGAVRSNPVRLDAQCAQLLDPLYQRLSRPGLQRRGNG